MPIAFHLLRLEFGILIPILMLSVFFLVESVYIVATLTSTSGVLAWSHKKSIQSIATTSALIMPRSRSPTLTPTN